MLRIEAVKAPRALLPPAPTYLKTWEEWVASLMLTEEQMGRGERDSYDYSEIQAAIHAIYMREKMWEMTNWLLFGTASNNNE